MCVLLFVCERETETACVNMGMCRRVHVDFGEGKRECVCECTCGLVFVFVFECTLNH